MPYYFINWGSGADIILDNEAGLYEEDVHHLYWIFLEANQIDLNVKVFNYNSHYIYP